MIEQIINDAKNKCIDDIIMVGFIDIDEIAQFYSDKRFLYFQIGEIYIEFASIEQFSRLRIRTCDEIPFDYEIDEDMIRGKTSIAELILNDSMSIGNSITSASIYDLDRKNYTCAALELILENGQILFLDPSFYFGINIGDNRQKDIWKDNYLYIDSVDVHRI
ncbi:MAG: hypothetical protein K6G88_05245 [Lachnospiraceae bacterium]|nr:hypothetical protein [Lachnospiraceae bacterium]